MRSRAALFASTVTMAFAVAGGVAIAHQSDCDPTPTVTTYEVSHAITKTTTSYVIKWVFFIIPVKEKVTTTVPYSVVDQCNDQLAKDDRDTDVKIEWGPNKSYCWVTVTETGRR